MKNENIYNMDGTKVSGFVTGKENKPPRQCSNCVWMGLESCGNPLVLNDPEVPKRESDDRAPVDEDDCCNGFQSRGNVLIYCVRHGDTEFNEKNAFRGWINIDIDSKGIKHAKEAAKYLADKGIKEVYVSDLLRTRHTGKIIAPNITKVKDKNLRPWNVGTFTGKPKDIYQDDLNWYIDNPDEDVPQGESLQYFAERQAKAFQKYIKIAKENGPILLVFHSSNCIQFQKQAEGKGELGRPEDVDVLSPGGIMAILEEDGKYKCEVIFGKPKVASYGS